jgi:hypothetical protein
MKLAKFFSTLLNRVLGTLPSEQVTASRAKSIRRDLESDPALQRIAQLAGNERRTTAHRRSCLQAYDHKRVLVTQGKGHHTLTGTPAASAVLVTRVAI